MAGDQAALTRKSRGGALTMLWLFGIWWVMGPKQYTSSLN